MWFFTALAVGVLVVAVFLAIYFAVTPKLRGKLSITQAKRPEIPTPYGMQKPPSDAELRHTRKEHPPLIKCEYCPRAAVWRRMAMFACDQHRKKLGGNPRRIVGKPHGSDLQCGRILDTSSVQCALREGHPGGHWDGQNREFRKEGIGEK